jgi:uncharacterized protein YaaN involved in tellurite resistance
MTDELTLAPPEALAPPAPVETVPQEKAGGMVPLDQATLSRLDDRVAGFVEGVISSEVQSKPFNDFVSTVHNMGSKEIRAASSVSNRMLDRPAKAMDGGLFDENSPVSQGLVDLRMTIEDLDPAQYGDLLAPKKLFGIIPFGNKLRSYFLKYESSQKHINAIINTLNRGKDELQKDNAAIEQEKANLWKMMQRMQQYVYMGKKIDEALESRIADIEMRSPEKARVIKEEMLFYVRQKVQDLLTQLAVSIQGYLALDMVRKNNLELIKGVDRATTTTVSALRTAVIVSQALANQKLVLDQINALNTTTSNMIESTSKLLKQQSADIHQQAASSTVGIQQLQTAFNNIYETMDMISDYKVKALDSMKETVNILSTEVEKAQQYVARSRGEIPTGAGADETGAASAELPPAAANILDVDEGE